MEVKRGESSTNIRTIIEDALLEERECAVEGDHKGSINLYWGQAGDLRICYKEIFCIVTQDFT